MASSLGIGRSDDYPGRLPGPAGRLPGPDIPPGSLGPQTTPSASNALAAANRHSSTSGSLSKAAVTTRGAPRTDGRSTPGPEPWRGASSPCPVLFSEDVAGVEGGDIASLRVALASSEAEVAGLRSQLAASDALLHEASARIGRLESAARAAAALHAAELDVRDSVLLTLRKRGASQAESSAAAEAALAIQADADSLGATPQQPSQRCRSSLGASTDPEATSVFAGLDGSPESGGGLDSSSGGGDGAGGGGAGLDSAGDVARLVCALSAKDALLRRTRAALAAAQEEAAVARAAAVSVLAAGSGAAAALDGLRRGEEGAEEEAALDWIEQPGGLRERRAGAMRAGRADSTAPYCPADPPVSPPRPPPATVALAAELLLVPPLWLALRVAAALGVGDLVAPLLLWLLQALWAVTPWRGTPLPLPSFCLALLLEQRDAAAATAASSTLGGQ